MTFNEPAWLSAISVDAFVDLRLGKQDYTNKLITLQKTTTVVSMDDARFYKQLNYFFFRKNCGWIEKIILITSSTTILKEKKMQYK